MRPTVGSGYTWVAAGLDEQRPPPPALPGARPSRSAVAPSRCFGSSSEPECDSTRVGSARGKGLAGSPQPAYLYYIIDHSSIPLARHMDYLPIVASCSIDHASIIATNEL